jgi:DNA-binding transcriptional regulator PaaX
MITGAVYIAASSPYFIRSVLRARKKWKKYSKKTITNAFYNLRSQNLIEIKGDGKQIYISLTEKGRKKAGYMQIDALDIKKPKVWDKKWRIVIFDISELKRVYREAFRGKLKELGFYQLQKSVWIHPFDCRAEIELLRDFFGLRERELKLIVADDIGNDTEIKEKFMLN